MSILFRNEDKLSKRLKEDTEDKYHTDPKFRQYRNQYLQNDIDCSRDIAYVQNRVKDFSPMSRYIFKKNLGKQYMQGTEDDPYQIVFMENQVEWHNSALEDTLEDMKTSKWLKHFKKDNKKEEEKYL